MLRSFICPATWRSIALVAFLTVGLRSARATTTYHLIRASIDLGDGKPLTSEAYVQESLCTYGQLDTFFGEALKLHEKMGPSDFTRGAWKSLYRNQKEASARTQVARIQRAWAQKEGKAWSQIVDEGQEEEIIKAHVKAFTFSCYRHSLGHSFEPGFQEIGRDNDGNVIWNGSLVEEKESGYTYAHWKAPLWIFSTLVSEAPSSLDGNSFVVTRAFFNKTAGGLLAGLALCLGGGLYAIVSSSDPSDQDVEEMQEKTDDDDAPF